MLGVWIPYELTFARRDYFGVVWVSILNSAARHPRPVYAGQMAANPSFPSNR